jgi:hypothetical protein
MYRPIKVTEKKCLKCDSTENLAEIQPDPNEREVVYFCKKCSDAADEFFGTCDVPEPRFSEKGVAGAPLNTEVY